MEEEIRVKKQKSEMKMQNVHLMPWKIVQFFTFANSFTNTQFAG